MRIHSGVPSTSKTLFLVALLAGTVVAAAQQPAAKPQTPAPRIEVTYDYMHSNAPPGGCTCISLNGAGGALVYPLKSAPLAFVGGFAFANGGHIGANDYGLTLFTYTVGARYLPKLKSKSVQPYGEIQLGGVHASDNLAAATGLGSAFAGSIGGGIDTHLWRGVSLKLVDAQYLVTTFPNGNNNHQNNLRVRTGLVFSLGKASKGQTH